MKKYRFSLSLLLFSALALSIISFSLSWYANQKLTDSDLGFSGGELGDYTMYKLTYDGLTEAQSVETVSSIGKEFSISELEFGKINNLSSIDASNYIFYVIEVPKEFGGTVNLGVGYLDDTADSHFSIYVPQKNAQTGDNLTDANGNLITQKYTDASVLTALHQVEDDQNDTYISYAFAVSENAPEEYAVFSDIASLFEAEVNHSLGDVTDNTPNTRTVTVDTSTIAQDSYYVYIRLQPNLPLYSHFIDYLWSNMPFCLSYNVRINFWVTP